MNTNLALLLGKLSARAIKVSGVGLASNVPGRIARKVYPHVLRDLAAQAKYGVLAITGTNGKSTSCGLLSSILKEAGFKIVHNRQGANLITGITASLVESADLSGNLNCDYCLFEIDEATLPLVAQETKFKAVAVTNLFRDQLDRFGELDTTAKLISKGINGNTAKTVLNADDPNVARLAPDQEKIYFGIETLAQEQKQTTITAAEAATCTKCGADFNYRQTFFGQQGHYFCPNCQTERPSPQVYAKNVSVHAEYSTFELHIGTDHANISLSLPGLFNVYNALAASAMASVAGVPITTIKKGLETYDTLFGRSEKLKVQGKNIIVQLIKNPVGASQAVSAVALDPEAYLLVAINDNYADGRDISWLWDTDFEQLEQFKGPIMVSGKRADDMAVRLKYAGTTVSNLTVEPNLANALNEVIAKAKEGQTVWLLPTYTCLLELQKIFKDLGSPMSGT